MQNKPLYVQRLSTPKIYYINDHAEGFINPYGNTLNEINNESVQKACALVFDPDYMGAAEYEWGALPTTMSKMWEDTKLYTTLLNIPDKNIKYKIYVVATNDNIYINKPITIKYLDWLYSKGKKREEVAKNDYGSFYKSINQIDSINTDRLTVGWFSLDKHFAFFINKDMARNFNRLFSKRGLEELHYKAKLIHNNKPKVNNNEQSREQIKST